MIRREFKYKSFITEFLQYYLCPGWDKAYKKDSTERCFKNLIWQIFWGLDLGLGKSLCE